MNKNPTWFLCIVFVTSIPLYVINVGRVHNAFFTKTLFIEGYD